MALQTEKWNVLIREFSGLYTARNSDEIPDGHSPNLLNVRINGSHIRGAGGYELAGARLETGGAITAQYTYARNDGQERMVRVRDDGAAGVLEWFDATNPAWYALLPALTTGTRMGFAEFNTSSTNQMICCNGVQNVAVWTGSTTRLTASASGLSDTLQVASTADFPATGTVIYNGIETAYDSKTATTFHATAGNWPASAGDDDGVAQAIDDSTHSGITKGNILLSAKDRLWIAGQPAAPNNLDYSDEGNAFQFTGGSNRADSGTEDFFNIGGAISGLAEKGDEIIVLGPDGGDGFSFTYPTATTKAPIFREIFRSKGTGCTSPASVFKVNNEVYFTNRSGVQALGDLEGSDKVFNRSITRTILPTTRELDFSDAASIFHERESILLVACKSGSEAAGNDTVLGFEFYQDPQGNDRIGITRLDWPAGCWAVLGDDLYFGSSLEMNSFKGFSTYQNDGAPRTIRYAIKRHHLGDPFQSKGSRLAAVRGMIKDGTDISVTALFNAGFKGEQTKTIQSVGDYVSQAALNTLGAFAIGTNPIGASLSEVGELKQFIVFLDLGVDAAWSDVQLVIESETDGGTFLIDALGFAIDTEGYASEDQLTI